MYEWLEDVLWGKYPRWDLSGWGMSSWEVALKKTITINNNDTKTESNMKETKEIFFRVLMEPHGYPWISHFRAGYTVITKLQSCFHAL